MKLGIKTIQMLWSEKHEVVFFQNPSIMLGLICALYKKFNRKCLVVGDFHNAALDSGKLESINAFIARSIDITLVSNKNLFARVRDMGGRPFAFPDPIPLPQESHSIRTDNGRYILFISSWADDEPINNVLDAFILSELWKDSIELRVTGKVKASRLNKPIEQYESHGIRFLGFVSEADYWAQLTSASLNVDLTTREDCLVCGAYEAIAVCAPILLSNNEASVSYFGKYAQFTDNSVADIKNNMLHVINNQQLIHIGNRENRESYLEADLICCTELKAQLAKVV